jgi:molybdenum cofactor biosynthesis protein B
MVDFQNRDTDRGLGTDDDTETESEAEEDPDGEPQDTHDHHEHDLETLGVGVVTISSSRSSDDNPAGDAITDGLTEAGHEIAIREFIRDEYDTIQSTVDRLTDREDVDCVVTTGGTGVTPDDITIEAVDPLLDKFLPGFGELFRTLSREEIGTRVVGTRAMAGIADGVPVFVLPGSEHAARLGTEEIILEEAGHLAGLASRDEQV